MQFFKWYQETSVVTRLRENAIFSTIPESSFFRGTASATIMTFKIYFCYDKFVIMIIAVVILAKSTLCTQHQTHLKTALLHLCHQI